MGKGNNRKQQRNSGKQPISKRQSPEITDSDKEEIEETLKDSGKLVESVSLKPEEELSEEAQSKLESAEEKQNLKQYWDYVKAINRNIEAVKKKYEEQELTLLEKEEQFDIEKEKLDAEQSELKKRQEEVNNKWKELTKRESALLAGDYPESVKDILGELENASKEVQEATAEAVKELSAQVKKHLKEIIKYGKSKEELDAQLQLLEVEKKKLENDNLKLEKRRENLERIIEKELEKRIGEERESHAEEVEDARFKLERVEKRLLEYKEKIDTIKSKFGGTDPKEILQITNEQTAEISRLQAELEERPRKSDLELLQSELRAAEKIAEEMQARVEEEQLLELRQRFQGHETFEFERVQLKNQVEGMTSRIDFMGQTLEEKDKMIEQLQGERNQVDEAFEFVSKLDANNENQSALVKKKGSEPKNLEALIDFVQNKLATGVKPLFYDEHTLRTFLAGLHMSPMTLLTGISGTGKTSLAREFCRVLISDKKYQNRGNTPFEIVAVQSGWRDRSDLFGYFNSFEKRYKETDFFRALYRANLPKYRNTLFFIVMDEMNLSRPEHYFADFLSALEQIENERFIRLDGVPTEVYPEVIKTNEGELPIPPNVRFIGTANHDESTLEFAPKTIDRSNLMEMPKNADRIKKTKKPNTSYDIPYEWLSKQFESAEETHEKDFETFQGFIEDDSVRKLFGEMNLGAGNRLDDQAKRFIGVYRAAGGDLAQAADHLITSRVLRNLKDKYQFTKDSLEKFHVDYSILFGAHFGPKDETPEPTIANSLLEVEIKKKEK